MEVARRPFHRKPLRMTRSSARDDALRLLPIEADGSIAESLPRDEPVRSVCAAMTALYQSVGFEPPWIGYIADLDGNAVGTCAFKSPPREGRVEIAYFTFPPHEGRGVATRMAGLLLEIARNADPELTVIAQTLPEENASVSVLRRHGFSLTGSVSHPEDGVVWDWHRPAAAIPLPPPF